MAILAPHDIPGTTGSFLMRRAILMARPELDMTPGEVVVGALDQSSSFVWDAWQALPLEDRPHLVDGRPLRQLLLPLTGQLGPAPDPGPLPYLPAPGPPMRSPTALASELGHDGHWLDWCVLARFQGVNYDSLASPPE